MPLQHHTVLRQGPGFVRAQHVYRAEVLDGLEPFDHDLFLGHGPGALREVHSDDHGQHFRRETDRDGEAEQEGFSTQSPLVMPTMKYTAQTMTTMKRIISQVKGRTPRSKLVGSRRSANRAAIDPKRVCVPVGITTPRAAPLVTLLPRKHAFGSSQAPMVAHYRHRLIFRRPWILR